MPGIHLFDIQKSTNSTKFQYKKGQKPHDEHYQCKNNFTESTFFHDKSPQQTIKRGELPQNNKWHL